MCNSRSEKRCLQFVVQAFCIHVLTFWTQVQVLARSVEGFEQGNISVELYALDTLNTGGYSCTSKTAIRILAVFSETAYIVDTNSFTTGDGLRVSALWRLPGWPAFCYVDFEFLPGFVGTTHIEVRAGGVLDAYGNPNKETGRLVISRQPDLALSASSPNPPPPRPPPIVPSPPPSVLNFALEQKLVASDGSRYDYFGRAVDATATCAVVGAYYDDDRGRESGSVYLFTQSYEHAWTQEQKLIPADGAAGDDFGTSVALIDGRLAVGAPGCNDRGDNAGAVYVYFEGAEGWALSQKIVASDGAAYDRFGFFVAMTPQYLAVGAYDDDHAAGQNSGSVYIYQYTGGSWYLVIGSCFDDDAGSTSGSVYVYTLSGAGEWELQTKLTAYDAVSYDYFGWSVSIEAGYLAVGADDDDDLGSGSGSVYIYGLSGNTWTFEQKLSAPDGASGDSFGEAVSLSNGYLAIGSDADDDRGSSSGSVYIYMQSAGNVWSYIQKLVPGDGGTLHKFGRYLALRGADLIISAYRDDDMGDESGSAYIFSAIA
ncbi:hypothetical protein CYMTET_23015 [Cymbomonas tetramitiformis]|uniref:FG-GAP repeat protein n=1 Tax=Cymbomonas tetramitiformis TaxID=36881 RepID=A0AAE0FYS1_9CHLO|nr:hypothetical protein CYMTET_23015 [Cymbomonas tetramitiformis]